MAPRRKTRRINRGEVRLPGRHLALEAGKWTSVIIPFTVPPWSQAEGVEVRFIVSTKEFASDEGFIWTMWAFIALTIEVMRSTGSRIMRQ